MPSNERDQQLKNERRPLLQSRDDVFESAEYTTIPLHADATSAKTYIIPAYNGQKCTTNGDPEENRRTWKEMFNSLLPLLVLMITEAPRGIFVPTLVVLVCQLGGDTAYLGYVVAAFSVGRFVSTTFLGYWSGKRTYKEVFAWSLIFSLVGNIMHAFSIVGGKELLLVSKFIAGLGAGVLSVVRAYASAVTTPKERTSFMSAVGAVQFVGFALSPGLGTAFEYFPKFAVFKLEVTPLTSPALFLCALDLISIAAIILLFENPPDTNEKKKESDETTSKWGVIYTFGFFLALNFIVRFVLGIVETLGAPIHRIVRTYPDEIDQQKATGMYFLVLGIFGLLDLFLIGYLSRKISDVYLLLFGLLSLCCGSAVFLLTKHLNFLTMTVGFAFIWSVGFPLAQTIIVSMFSKVIGPGPQGTMMGWIGVMGSLGRVVGPIFAGWMMQAEGIQIVFLCAFCISVLSLMLSFASWKVLWKSSSR